MYCLHSINQDRVSCFASFGYSLVACATEPPADVLCPAGRALRFLGLPVALSVLPTSAGLLMAGIALWPAPASGEKGQAIVACLAMT